MLVRRVDGTLTSRTRTLRQPRESHLVGEVLAALLFRFLLFGSLRVEIGPQSANGVVAGQHCQNDADDVPDVPAVARQVGHKLDEKLIKREEDEAPDEGPVRARAAMDEEPSSEQEQRQRKGETQQEDTCLHAKDGEIVAALARLLDLALGCDVLSIRPLEGVALLFERVELLRVAQQFGVLAGLSRGGARGDPVVKLFAFGAGVCVAFKALRRATMSASSLSCNTARSCASVWRIAVSCAWSI